jgi:hypothetical protein
VCINIILRVRVTTVKLKSSKYYIFCTCVCSLSYPAWNAHALYFSVISVLSVSIIFFPHYFINGAIFWKKKINDKKTRVLIFSTNFDSMFVILRRIQRDGIIHVYRYSCKVPVILVEF